METELKLFIQEKTKDLICLDTTRAYIQGVFSQLHPKDFSKESLTLIFAKAKSEGKFDLYQNLADWILLSRVIFPRHLTGASPEYYSTLAQICYYRCYLLLNKEWKLFEELADRFPSLTKQLEKKLDLITQIF